MSNGLKFLFPFLNRSGYSETQKSKLVELIIEGFVAENGRDAQGEEDFPEVKVDFLVNFLLSVVPPFLFDSDVLFPVLCQYIVRQSLCVTSCTMFFRRHFQATQVQSVAAAFLHPETIQPVLLWMALSGTCWKQAIYSQRLTALLLRDGLWLLSYITWFVHV